jgi:hypothetical protein
MSRGEHEEGAPEPAQPAAVGRLLVLVGAVVFLGLCGVGILAAVLLAAPQTTATPAAQRLNTGINLSHIGLALHNYYAAHGRLPPPWTTTSDGKPGLSWRVLILPHIEQDNLYKQFRLDEPWDSPNNRSPSAAVVKTYCHPDDPLSSLTRFRVFVGGGAAFEPGKKTLLRLARNPDELDFADGMSKTILVVEAADAVPWAKPEELDYNAAAPLPKLGHPAHGGDFHALLADGRVRTIERTTAETTVRALITCRGGEPLPDDF